MCRYIFQHFFVDIVNYSKRLRQQKIKFYINNIRDALYCLILKAFQGIIVFVL